MKEINKLKRESEVLEFDKSLFTEEQLASISKLCNDLENGKIFAPKKYFKSQKDMLIRNTDSLYQSSPDLPLKQVLFKIMQPLPDFLPAENLVAVTKIITSTWEELRKKIAA